MRRRIAIAMLLLGLLTTGVFGVLAYLARSVLDERAFSDRLVTSLERPGMSAFVAQRVADGVVAANRDLIGIRPLIATLAEGVVRSAPFRALVRRAARETHRVAFSEGTENVLLSIPDVGVLLRGTLENASPEIAQRIPADVQAVVETQFTGATSGRILAALRAAQRLRAHVRLGLGLGLLLVLGSVAVSPARRQALLNAGIGLLAVSGGLTLVVPLGGAAVTGAVADPGLRAAIGDLWGTFTTGLWTWASGLAVVALMMVAWAAALFDRVALRDIAHRGLAEIATRQTSRPREGLRVAALFTIAGFAIAAPLSTLASAVVVAGALTLLLAVHELITLVVPAREREAHGAATVHLNPALGIALGGVLAVAALLGVTALAFRVRPPEALATAVGSPLECNGAVALCDRRLDEITFAGAHNAMGSSDDPTWMFPNQDASIPRLLRRGVRAFLIDVTRGHAVDGSVITDFQTEEHRRKFEAAIGPEAFAAAMRVRDQFTGKTGRAGLYLCHGFCELGAIPFDTALAHVKRFLVTNPREIVLLVLEDYVPAHDIAASVEQQGLLSYLYTGPARGPFPTLGEMIASGQRLFVMGENTTGEVPWYPPAYAVMKETPYTFHAPEEFSCRPNRGEGSNPIFLMNHWIETTPSPRPSNAALVNTEAAIVARARECERERGTVPNIVAVDFAATGDVVRAAAVLNGLVPPTP